MPPVTTRSKTDPRGERLSRPERVAEAIKAWVVDERLQPGDRLPSEPELIERFAMAKSTIREAMRLLEAQGLVRTRTGPGGGSFVHEVSRGRAQALLGNYFYFRDLTIRDIYQLRRALEPELAASLAGKLSEETLGRLGENIHEYDMPAKTPEEERAQHVASLRFHQILAEAAENELLGFIIGFMATMLAEVTVTRRLYEPRNTELWERGKDYQTRLLMALRAGDRGAARAIMLAHMRTAQALMEGQEAEMHRRFMSERSPDA
ncbi:FadR/GntR family transcriptional regulator [Acidimangrovimonas sediminis]|uniref:FadR/GntR family transcriptional regulator n=1 Tax=Acidimangrovimonas sediminis TaxID=2056283 RepID=UPI000C7FBD09|nr:FCD domain-containing protein [Acidimangrovimonas sediminis]